MRRNEFVNWRSHPTLNEVTKMCIEHFEHNYTFDEYLEDRSKKDNKFENPLKKSEEDEEQEEQKEEGSEFSFSEEDEEMSYIQEWDPRSAEGLYKGTKDEIESRYFIV
mmetsp:Transcript_24590/g.18636  ORF Transcript_24590/g.18636 Transcript_24590/m.18636 type:complete len:108 (+) Transcript_24590:101-424(+)